MTVRALGSQKAQHDSGAILSNIGAGFEEMRFDFAGHTLTLQIEMLRNGILFYVPESPRWDDETPMAPETVAQMKSIIEEIGQFWEMRIKFKTVP